MSTHDTATTWKQRLRRRAEAIVSAVEALPAPANAAEVTRQARALITAYRMIDVLFDIVRPRAPTVAAKPPAQKEPSAASERDKVEVEVIESVLADLPPMNRQQRRLAERLLRKSRSEATA